MSTSTTNNDAETANAIAAMAAKAARALRSKRLVFHTPDPENPKHMAMFLELRSDTASTIGGGTYLPAVPTPADARTALAKRDAPLTAVICLDAETQHGGQPSESSSGVADPTTTLPASTTSATEAAAIPIGLVSLTYVFGPAAVQHRTARLGIEILRRYHGLGYGTETVAWTLDYGFDAAGLHSITLGCFSWNLAAKRVYENVGFRPSGVDRQCIWAGGRFWDIFNFDMIEDEWREKRERIWHDVVARKA